MIDTQVERMFDNAADQAGTSLHFRGVPVVIADDDFQIDPTQWSGTFEPINPQLVAEKMRRRLIDHTDFYIDSRGMINTRIWSGAMIDNQSPAHDLQPALEAKVVSPFKGIWAMIQEAINRGDTVPNDSFNDEQPADDDTQKQVSQLGTGSTDVTPL